MHVHVLGSAAGGGVPQWNCACDNCEAARRGELRQRTGDALAVSADRRCWLLFNTSSDIRSQLAGCRYLAPRDARTSPIAAVFLTDANVDHCSGLLEFRQAASWQVYSTRAVRETLIADRAFAPFAAAPRRWDAIDDAPVTVAGLRVTAVAVPGSLPSFAGSGNVDGAACAYRIEGAGGDAVLYAPIFSETTEALARELDRCDAAFLDGTFYTDDEMPALHLSNRSARQMGHAPMDGPGGSIDAFSKTRCRHKFFTHLNNSNPVLDATTRAAERVCTAGFALAEDGMDLVFGRAGDWAERVAGP